MVKKLNLFIFIQLFLLLILLAFVFISNNDIEQQIYDENASISSYDIENLYKLIKKSNLDRDYTFSGYIEGFTNNDTNVYGMVKDNSLTFYNKISYQSKGLLILDEDISDDIVYIYGKTREVMNYASLKPIVDSSDELVYSQKISESYDYRLLNIDLYLETILNDKFSINEKTGTFTITNYHRCEEMMGFFDNLILTTYPLYSCQNFAVGDDFNLFSSIISDGKEVIKEDNGLNSRMAIKLPDRRGYDNFIKYIEIDSTFDIKSKQLISMKLNLPSISYDGEHFKEGISGGVTIKFYENEANNILRDAANVPFIYKVYNEENIINFITNSIINDKIIEIDDGIDISVLQTILEMNITNKNHMIEFFQKSKFKNSFISFSNEKGQVFKTDVINQMKCVAEFSKGDYMFDCLYEEKYQRYSNDEFLNESQEERSFSFIEVDSKQYEKVDSKYTRTHFYRYEDEIETMSLALHFNYIDELYMIEDNDYYILDILPSYLPTSNLIFNAHYFNSNNEDIDYPPLYRVFVNKDTLLTEKIVYLYNGNDMADGGGDSFTFFDEYSVEMRFYDYGEARSDITNLIEQ